MVKPKLSYFDFPGGRGEDCRIALHIAGVDFEDDRIKGAQWADRKAEMPFGAMPVLQIGDDKLGQSNAILRLIGTRHELHPTDEWEAARHDAIMHACEDLRWRITSVMGEKDATKKKQVREDFAAGSMQHWGANMEAQIDNEPFLAGDRINVADLKLYVLLEWFATGGVDHVPTDVFKAFPKLTALYNAVKDHPKVQAWYAR